MSLSKLVIIHLLLDSLPSFLVNTGLLDKNGHPSKLDDVSLADDCSLLKDLFLLVHASELGEVAELTVRGDHHEALPAQVFQLLGNEVILPLYLLREVQV